MTELTHLDGKGAARMVDVGEKPVSLRRALAQATLTAKPEVIRRLAQGDVPKGDAFAAARIAGILAAKRTDELIPLCHSLALDSVSVEFEVGEGRIRVRAEARLHAKTGAEMEALLAASVAALTLYDMGKALDREMIVSDVMLLEKEGGVRGAFKRTRPKGDEP